MHTDVKRLQQIIKNLLSNAFKFTQAGRVSLSVAPGERRLVARERRAEPGRARDRLHGDAIPASASRRTSSTSSSRRSSRRTAAPAASTAERASGSPSAASSRKLLGGEIRLTARRAWAAPSPCTCRNPTLRPAHAPAHRQPAGRDGARAAAARRGGSGVRSTSRPSVAVRQRGGRRPRRHQAGRRRAADRRERSRFRQGAARRGAAARDSRVSSRAAARPRSR